MSIENEQLIANRDTTATSRNLVLREPNAGELMAPSPSEMPPAKPPLPAKAEWPVWDPLTFGWWAKAYAVSAGLVGFYYKVLTAETHPIRALVVALLLPPVALAFDRAVRYAATAYRRFAQYEQLRDSLSATQADLDQTRQQLSATEFLVRYLLVGSRRIEIQRVQRIDDRVLLTLKPKKTIKLQRGNRIQVVDFTDGAIMGALQITETTPVCLAQAPLRDLNPVWSGFIHEAGAESSAPGNSAAVLIEKETDE